MTSRKTDLVRILGSIEVLYVWLASILEIGTLFEQKLLLSVLLSILRAIYQALFKY